MKPITHVSDDWADGFLAGTNSGARRFIRAYIMELKEYAKTEDAVSASELIKSLQHTLLKLDGEQG